VRVNAVETSETQVVGHEGVQVGDGLENAEAVAIVVVV